MAKTENSNIKLKTSFITNDIVMEYVNSTYKPLNDQLAALRQKAEEDLVPIILRDCEELILNLMRLRRPKSILEIGTAVGYSSVCFASMDDDITIHTIELDEETAETAGKNIRAFGMEDRIKVHVGAAQDILVDMADSGEFSFDMVFIDAAKSHYRKFFDQAVRMCTDDAIIISDNVLLKGSTASDEFFKIRRFRTNIRNMREYLEYIKSLDYAHTSISPMGDGLALTILDKGNK